MDEEVVVEVYREKVVTKDDATLKQRANNSTLEQSVTEINGIMVEMETDMEIDSFDEVIQQSQSLPVEQTNQYMAQQKYQMTTAMRRFLHPPLWQRFRAKYFDDKGRELTDKEWERMNRKNEQSAQDEESKEKTRRTTINSQRTKISKNIPSPEGYRLPAFPLDFSWRDMPLDQVSPDDLFKASVDRNPEGFVASDMLPIIKKALTLEALLVNGEHFVSRMMYWGGEPRPKELKSEEEVLWHIIDYGLARDEIEARKVFDILKSKPTKKGYANSRGILIASEAQLTQYEDAAGEKRYIFKTQTGIRFLEENVLHGKTDRSDFEYD